MIVHKYKTELYWLAVLYLYDYYYNIYAKFIYICVYQYMYTVFSLEYRR